jgi:hypothetical protein
MENVNSALAFIDSHLAKLTAPRSRHVQLAQAMQVVREYVEKSEQTNKRRRSRRPKDDILNARNESKS